MTRAGGTVSIPGGVWNRSAYNGCIAQTCLGRSPIAMLRRIQPHLPGLLYTGLLALVAVAAMNNQNNLLFWVLGVLVTGLVISGGLSTYIIRTLTIRRLDPHHGMVGEPLFIRYAVTNRSRWLSAFNIHVDERSLNGEMFRGAEQRFAPSAWIMHTGPRETVHGELILWPTRRGKIAFDRLRVWTTFPFGIVRKHRTLYQPQHTLIFPKRFELRPGVLKQITPPALLGSRVSHHSGAGDDYYGTREYRAGDSMRHIAWKRSARADQLITIDRTSPSPAKLRIILDFTVSTAQIAARLSSPSNTAPQTTSTTVANHQARELEEQAISLAASLVYQAELEGYEVGMTVVGLPMPSIALRRNRWHFNKIMAALAEIELDHARIPAQPQPIRDAERALLVVIAPDRIQPLPGREDAWYLSARQLDSLVSHAGPQKPKDKDRLSPSAPRREVIAA